MVQRVKPWTNLRGPALSASMSGTGTVDQPAIEAVLNTKFDGVTLREVSHNPPSATVFDFTGTDQTTGYTFAADNPELWGSTRIPWRYRIGTLSQDNPYNHWDPRIITGIAGGAPDGSGTALRIERLTGAVNDPPYQSDFNIFTDTLWQQQGMIYQRMKFRILPFDTGVAGNYWELFATKLNGAGGSSGRLSVFMSRSGGFWWIDVFASNSSGIGQQAWAGSTCDPPADSFVNDSRYFSKGFAVADPDGPVPDFGKWWTLEFAFRFQDSNGNVLGNAAQGWTWVSIAEGTENAAPANGTGVQRFYIAGRNTHDVFSETSPSGAALVFPLLHYSNFNAPLTMDIGSLELYEAWPDDASSHPLEAT